MSQVALTQEQIRTRGLKVLSLELGPVGLVRFLQQFETGQGDYTAERHQWLGTPKVQELAEEIEKLRDAAIHRKDDERP
jgi:hypothetical protein